MDNRVIKNNLLIWIEKNVWIIMFIVLFFCIGVVLGSYTVKYMNAYNSENLYNYFVLFSQNITAKSFNSKELILEAVRNNLLIIAAIWALGFTVIGVPVILLLNMIKGYTFGFAFYFILAFWEKKAFAMAVVSLVPHNFIYISCIIIISVYSFRLSLDKWKVKMSRSPQNSNKAITGYLYSFVIILLLMFFGILIETIITPGIIRYMISG